LISFVVTTSSLLQPSVNVLLMCSRAILQYTTSSSYRTWLSRSPAIHSWKTSLLGSDPGTINQLMSDTSQLISEQRSTLNQFPRLMYRWSTHGLCNSWVCWRSRECRYHHSSSSFSSHTINRATRRPYRQLTTTNRSRSHKHTIVKTATKFVVGRTDFIPPTERLVI